MLFWIGYDFLYYLVAVSLSVVTVSDKNLTHTNTVEFIVVHKFLPTHCVTFRIPLFLWIHHCLVIRRVFCCSKNTRHFCAWAKLKDFLWKGLLCFCFVVFVNSEPSIIQVYNFFIMAAFIWESTFQQVSKFKIKIRPKGGRRTGSKCADTSLVV